MAEYWAKVGAVGWEVQAKEGWAEVEVVVVVMVEGAGEVVLGEGLDAGAAMVWVEAAI